MKLKLLKIARFFHLISKRKYNEKRQIEVVKKSPLFDAKWYLAQNPDIKSKKMGAAKHYVKYGWKEGRNPSKDFDGNAYLQEYPELVAKNWCPLFHYMTLHKELMPKVSIKEIMHNLANKYSKRYQGKSNDYKLIAKSKYFNKRWYLKQYPDVKKAGIDPIEHYLKYGWKEGRNPSQEFDTKGYLARYNDVKRANMNPLLHYLKFGMKEGRRLKYEIFSFPKKAIEVSCKFKNDNKKGRTAVFAMFSANGRIPDTTIYYLKGLKKIANNIILIADNPILEKEIKKIKDLVCYCSFIRHEEYDFGSYKRGYIYAKENGLLEKTSELILCNDSCYGPVFPFENMFNEMEKRDVDFWGITANIAFNYHIQSYFLAFKPNVFGSSIFSNFVSSIKKASRREVVLNYEVKFTNALQRAGFNCESYVEYSYNKEKYPYKFGFDQTQFPIWSLENKHPLIKVKNFTVKNFSFDNIKDVIYKMKEYNYDLYNLIKKRHKELFKNSLKDVVFLFMFEFVKLLNKVKKNIFNNKKIRILLVSHQMTYTGAPLSLLQAATCFKEKGMGVTVVSLSSGDLEKEFSRLGIKVKIIPTSSRFKLLYLSMAHDLAIINTLVPYMQYDLLSKLMPTTWWVRESSSFIVKNKKLLNIFSRAKNIYTMSEYSREQFLCYNPDISVIKHGFVDKYNPKEDFMPDVISFAVVGSIEDRKGQDIFIEAINKVSEKMRKEAKFYIIGKVLDKSFYDNIKEKCSSEVSFLPPIADSNKMLKFYNDMSCIVVPSRDEPTSRVAIEAMMMGRPVIMSNKVGAQYLLNESKNGYMFENENSEQLAKIIENIIDNPDKLKNMSEEARKAYLENNSMVVYNKKLFDIVNNVCMYGEINIDKIYKKKVVHDFRNLKLSIIVPVYNAVNDVKECLASILNSNLNSFTEIILMDDCSEKETMVYLQSFAKKHKNFKYYRNNVNLGFIKNCNRGIDLAKNNIVVLLNSDTKIPAGFDKRVIDCFRYDKNIACASPLCTNSGLFQIPEEGIYNYKKIDKIIQKEFSANYPMITPEGFCFAIRKEIVSKIGALDEIFGMGYREEDDFVMRSLFYGYKTVLIDNLLVYHKRHASFSSARRDEILKNNTKIFKQRWGEQQRYVREKMNICFLQQKIKTQIVDKYKKNNVLSK